MERIFVILGMIVGLILGLILVIKAKIIVVWVDTMGMTVLKKGGYNPEIADEILKRWSDGPIQQFVIICVRVFGLGIILMVALMVMAIITPLFE